MEMSICKWINFESDIFKELVHNQKS